MWISYWQQCTKELLSSVPAPGLSSCMSFFLHSFFLFLLCPVYFNLSRRKTTQRTIQLGMKQPTQIRYWMKYPLAMYVHVFCADLTLWHTTTRVRLNVGLDVKKAPCSHLPETGCSAFFHYRWQRCSFNSKWPSKEFCVQKVLFLYSAWICVGEAIRTSALLLVSHSAKHPLPHTAWGAPRKPFCLHTVTTSSLHPVLLFCCGMNSCYKTTP